MEVQSKPSVINVVATSIDFVNASKLTNEGIGDGSEFGDIEFDNYVSPDGSPVNDQNSDDPTHIANQINLASAFRVHSLLPGEPPHWRKLVFEPRAALARLNAANMAASPETEPARHESGISREHPQISHWRALAGDEYCGTRRLVVGTSQQADAVHAIADLAPNFSALFDLIAQALQASLATGTPFKLPPILLLGPPGVGKTYVASRLAEALQVPFVSVPMTTTTSVNALTGTDANWKAPKLGVVARALVEGASASPLILLDEADKAFSLRGDNDPLDALHVLLEAETAKNFRDDFLDMNLAADDVIWLLTANSLEPFAASILDRCLILPVKPPSPQQMSAMLASIHAGVIAYFGDWFYPDLSDVTARHLAGAHPRQIRRALEIACRRAASEKRKCLLPADIDAAMGLLRRDAPQQRAGFLA